MVRKKQHNDGLVDGNIHSKKRPSTTKFQYPKNVALSTKSRNATKSILTKVTMPHIIVA